MTRLDLGLDDDDVPVSSLILLLLLLVERLLQLVQLLLKLIVHAHLFLVGIVDNLVRLVLLLLLQLLLHFWWLQRLSSVLDLEYDVNQSILTSGGASQRNFQIKSGLAYMRYYFFSDKNTQEMVFVTKWHLMTCLLICLSQGGLAFHREDRPCTGRPGLSHGGLASHREARPLARRLGLSEGV